MSCYSLVRCGLNAWRVRGLVLCCVVWVLPLAVYPKTGDPVLDESVGLKSARDRLAELRAEISYHDDLYYRKSAPEISDAEYDVLKKEMRLLESMYPELVVELDALGDDRTGERREVRHGAPMLSLDKAYTQAELVAFYEDVLDRLGVAEVACLVEPKVDGMAISVRFEKGEFVRAVTRGNGEVGEDVSENALMVEGLPKRLKGEDIPERVELRGEVFVSFETFRRINEERVEAGEVPFSHPRNYAAGSVKLDDVDEVAARGLSVVFFGYGLYEAEGGEPVSQSGFYERARGWGVPVLDEVRGVGGIGELVDAVRAMQEERGSYSFPTDGLVVKVDSRALQSELGASATAPRWAVAYKFSAERVETRLLGITVQVGRTGLLTPVAELEAVELAGSTISRASLHNAGVIERLGLGIGDVVFLEKAGEVIPNVVGVNFEKRGAGVVSYVFPEVCPSCGVSVRREGVARYCGNATCPAQVQRRIEHFASSRAVGIDGLGAVTIEKLVAAGVVVDVADLYALDAEDFDAAGLGSGVSVGKLLAAIDESKEVELWRFVFGLGIAEVGASRAKALAEVFDGLEGLAAVEWADFEEGGRAFGLGFGPVAREAVLSYFGEAENRELARELVERGVRPRGGAREGEGLLAGKVFVFTGRLSTLTRTEARELVEAAGGVVRSVLSGKCDFLVVGEDPGQKLVEAEDGKIEILSEAAFLKLFSEIEGL